MPRQKPTGAKPKIPKVARKICGTCSGTGTVAARPPLKGRDRCPPPPAGCGGKQWVPA